jgi:hypothetical protein
MMFEFFGERMHISAFDAVALLGGHSIGHMHPEISGYGIVSGESANMNDNAWDSTPQILDNEYFKQLLAGTWINNMNFRTTENYDFVAEKATKNIWQWSQGELKRLVLNVDLALLLNVQNLSNFSCTNCGAFGQSCGPVRFLARDDLSSPVCSPPSGGFIAQTSPFVFPTGLVHQFANDNVAFLKAFVEAYKRVTCVG